jgi:hypothetical protein
MARIGAVLIDIDGVLTVSWQPLEGAVTALQRLRAEALPLALVTNTTSRTRASIAAVLADAGFPVTAADILTAPVIAAAYLARHYPGARCLLLNDGDIGEDLAGVTLAGEDDPAVDVVLTGGAGPSSATRRSTGPLATCSAAPGWSPCTAACTGAPPVACSWTAGRSSRAWSRRPGRRRRWWASRPRPSSPPRWPTSVPARPAP